MDDVDRIERDGVTYALVFRRDIAVPGGTRFPTQNADALQVGFFERAPGYASPPHRHISRKIDLVHPAEFLSIEQGRVSITVYDEAWTIVAERELTGGECIVFLRGGHALTVLEPARILEVKQGPYLQQDKIFRPTT